MQTLILTLHIIVCFLLVILILLQSGKEGMGVIFGGGNSSVFGSTGAGGILAKLTTLMAVIFIITSLSYTYVTSSKPASESVILNVKIEEPPAPAKSATPPASGDVAPEPKNSGSQPAIENNPPAAPEKSQGTEKKPAEAASDKPAAAAPTPKTTPDKPAEASTPEKAPEAANP